ncbi:TPA: hypothetical protein EYO57_22575 [Candidatus Poribacteria bacterium]|nr:hypothetical protein [Candidatus Poribacteria bacterium]
MGTNGSDFTSGLLNEWGKYIQAASGFADLKHLVRIADAENETGPESGLFVKELYSYQKSGVAWLKSYAISSFRTILADDMGQVPVPSDHCHVVRWQLVCKMVYNVVL